MDLITFEMLINNSNEVHCCCRQSAGSVGAVGKVSQLAFCVWRFDFWVPHILSLVVSYWCKDEYWLTA